MIVVVDPPGVRVEVSDVDHRHPETREATDEDASGRGLLLVDVLAVAWGVRGRGGGKCVRFELTE